MNFQYRISIKLCILISICTVSLSACSLSPDKTTMERQAKAPWWFGSSISDEVYSPNVQEEVYSK